MNNGVPHPKKKTTLGPVAGEVSLDGIEVTQVIQDMNHTVPLIANKRTVVRVYLSRPAGASLTVRGEIAVRTTPNGPAQTIPSLDTVLLKAEQNGKLRLKRESLSLSLNFRLPESLTRPGRIFIRLSGLKKATTGAVVPLPKTLPEVAVEFQTSAPLRVRLVRLRYQSGNPPVSRVATAQDLALIKSWLLRAYPVSQVIAAEVTVDANIGPPFDRDDGTNDCNEANAQISALRNLDISGGMDKRTHYYGLVADGGGFMRGCANLIPASPNPAAVASGPCGPDDFGWDTDGSYGDWYTGHELGHTFGRKHIGSGCGETNDDPLYPFPKGQLSKADGAFVGFDVGDTALGRPMTVMPGVAWHDVMSYCTNQWMSSYTFKGLLKRLQAEGQLSAGPTPAGDEAGSTTDAAAAAAMEVQMDSGSFINIVATVNLTRGTGKIMYVNPVANILLPAPDEASRASLRVRTADGQLIQEYPAVIKLNSCIEPGRDEKGVVDMAIPYESSMRVLELVLDGNVIDTYRAGAPPPEIGNIRRQPAAEALSDAADTGAASDLVSFQWDVAGGGAADALADAESSNVSYNVQVSADGGNTWQTVAVGRKTPDATIDRTQFPDASHIIVRVIATNGFDNSVATTDAMPVNSL